MKPDKGIRNRKRTTIEPNPTFPINVVRNCNSKDDMVYLDEGFCDCSYRFIDRSEPRKDIVHLSIKRELEQPMNPVFNPFSF